MSCRVVLNCVVFSHDCKYSLDFAVFKILWQLISLKISGIFL